MKIHISYEPNENNIKNKIVGDIKKIMPMARVKRKPLKERESRRHVYVCTTGSLDDMNLKRGSKSASQIITLEKRKYEK
jgi:hypothetical protein